MVVPTTNKRNLLPLVAQRPAKSIKGIIRSDGNDSSISTSSSLACGNIDCISSRMGDTAKPGSETIADTDHMATSAITDIVPLPVFTLIAHTLFTRCRARAMPTEACDYVLLCYALGSVMVNSKPPTLRLATVMSPPWKSTEFLTIERPRPVPPSLRERPLSIR